MDAFTMHSHTCGELSTQHMGQTVCLCGWVWHRRDHGGLIFVDLRDREGVTQIAFDPQNSGGAAFSTAESLRSEWVISVSGVVRLRPEGMANPKLTTGEIEVLVSEITVLNTAKTPPFLIEDYVDVAEDIRLKYRYLDLRRPRVAAALRLRSDFSFAVRRALHNRAFTEVETPYMFKSTPEGARDFLVPSRIQPGRMYALPQSPQLLKELLMVGGVERYYQVARCFRDEDLRSNRQPEFTQVDIEMSFVDQDDVLGALETVFHEAFAAVGVDMPLPLRRISYWDAMDTYGSDKPDTRFEMAIHDVTAVFAGSRFKLFSSAAAGGKYVKALNAKGAGLWPRARIDKLADVAAGFGAKGLAWIAFREDGSINSPIVKFFSETEMEALRSEMQVESGDLVMFAVEDRLAADSILGGMRSYMAEALDLVPKGTHDFLWVTDFPLLAWDDEIKRYTAVHQPFTQPVEADLDRLETDPLSVSSYTYDLVMDGCEAGGGGLRIHSAELQMRILKLLGFTEERARVQFGFLMDALEFGAPPMGGFALGLDRVCMLLAEADSIREVIAFPKTSNGSDLMSSAPSEVSSAQLKEVGLRLL